MRLEHLLSGEGRSASALRFSMNRQQGTRGKTQDEETENKVVLHDSPQACLQFCSMILYIQRGTRVSRPAAKTGSRPAVPPEAIHRYGRRDL